MISRKRRTLNFLKVERVLVNSLRAIALGFILLLSACGSDADPVTLGPKAQPKTVDVRVGSESSNVKIRTVDGIKITSWCEDGILFAVTEVVTVDYDYNMAGASVALTGTRSERAC
jgi:hypothetical protein